MQCNLTICTQAPKRCIFIQKGTSSPTPEWNERNEFLATKNTYPDVLSYYNQGVGKRIKKK